MENNKYCDETQRAAYRDLIRHNPNYQHTQHLDVLRTEEYNRLDRDGHIYLDYTGGGLYADRQVQEHAGDREGLPANPRGDIGRVRAHMAEPPGRGTAACGVPK